MPATGMPAAPSRRALTPRALALLAALGAILAFLAPGSLAGERISAESLERLRALASEPIEVEGLVEALAIVRDRNGTPHVVARNETDLFFAQGWVHARDRFFQMDLQRRRALGTLAELLGPAALASDVELRTLGLDRAAARSLEALSPESRAALEAYAAGVNAWLATNPLPIEYGPLELSEVPAWTALDSAAVSKAAAFALSFSLRDISATTRLLASVEAGAAAGFDGQALFFADLADARPFYPDATLPDAGVEPPFVELPGPGDEKAAAARKERSDALARVAAAAPLMREYGERAAGVPLLERALDPEKLPQGSNEWALSGALTTSGRPLIANDPHLALDAPPTFHQMGLHAPEAGWSVVGSNFPGAPYIVQGTNAFISWGSTVNPLDVTDVFNERVVVDPSSPSGLATEHGDAREPLIPIPQSYRYNLPGDGTPDNLADAPADGFVGDVFIPAVTLVVPRRNQGPVIALDLEAGTALSVAYVGFGPTRELDAVRGFNLAQGLSEFVAALQSFDVGSQNWVYGDVFGNIAYFASGELPLREDLQNNTVNGLPPFLVREGRGGNDWAPLEGEQPADQATPFALLPFAEMPQLVNPPAGYFVNANNDPTGLTRDADPLDQLRLGGGLYYLSGDYARGFRASRIARRLEQAIAKSPVDRATMQEIQADVVLPDVEALLPHLLAAFDNAGREGAPEPLAALAADERVAEAIERLRAWEGTAPTGVESGYDASDVEGLLGPVSEEEATSSVAATIYSVWRGQVIRRVADDTLDPLGVPRASSPTTLSFLRLLLDAFPATGGVGASGIDFFAGEDAADAAERRDLALLGALGDALDLLAGDAFARSFGGSMEQDDYRWGRLHRIVLDHPLGGPFSMPPAFGAVRSSFEDLPGLAVDGGFSVVDASSHDARADADEEFRFGGGPVRRLAAELGDAPGGTRALTILPGGPSGDPQSPLYTNQLGRWLTNDAVEKSLTIDQLLEGAIELVVAVPAGEEPGFRPVGRDAARERLGRVPATRRPAAGDAGSGRAPAPERDEPATRAPILRDAPGRLAR